MCRYQPATSFVARLMIGAGIVVLLAGSVEARGVRQVRSRAPDRRAASNVAKISERWAKEWTAKNLEALVALYAEDAVFLPATGSRVTGRTAIRELFAGALASHPSQLQVHSEATEQSGHLAYDSGEYEELSPSGDVIPSGRGNYLLVVRRQGKNRWRIVQHMWTDETSVGSVSSKRGE
jgi:uncharacterized protein (TIGR02246 family)